MNPNEIDINIHDVTPNDFRSYTLVDVREDDEVEFEPALAEFVHVPCSRFMEENTKLNKDGHYFVFCAMGGRSHGVVEYLRAQGFPNTFNVGGIATVNAYIKRLGT